MPRFSTVLAAVLAGLALPALAQTAPGFVVTAAGDTLRGEVALGTEAENARGVALTTGARTVRFGPADAQAFGVDGGRQYRRSLFQTRAVREADPVTPNDRLAFARVVRTGAADLLALETSAGRPLFFVQTDGEPVGLYVVRDEVGGGVGRRVRERPVYRQALLGVLGACGPDEATAAGLAYDEANLARVVDAYNGCRDAGYVAAAGPDAVRRPTTVSFEVGVDAAAGSFRRRGPRPTSLVDPGASALRVGAAVEVAPSLVPRAGRVVLGVEYAHDVARMYRSDLEARQINTLHGVLGVRAAGSVGGLAAYAGTGLMVGTVLDRLVAPVSPAEGVQAVRPASLRSSGGQYVEAGLGVPRTPVSVVARYEATSFSGGPVFVPFASGSTLGTRTVSVGLRARL